TIIWRRTTESNHQPFGWRRLSRPFAPTGAALHSWCQGLASNQRLPHLQSGTLPSELPWHCVVPKAGLEPARTSRLFLRQVCLPFHHLGFNLDWIVDAAKASSAHRKNRERELSRDMSKYRSMAHGMH